MNDRNFDDRAYRSDDDESPLRLVRLTSIPTGPSCFDCGGPTRRAGSCYVCEECGETSGCS